ncbi:MAG: DUF4271 domain-containing protein [Bacteroidales bacterium]
MIEQTALKQDSTQARFIFAMPQDSVVYPDTIELADPPFFLNLKEEGLTVYAAAQATPGQRFQGILRDKDTKELDGFGLVFIVCIFLAGIGLFSGRSILIESIKDFFKAKDRQNLFNESNGFTHKIKLTLVAQTILQLAYVLFLYFDTEGGRNLSDIQSYILYGAFLGVVLFFHLFTLALNRSLIITFSSERSFAVWKSGHDTALSVFGLVLLPFTLTVTYLDIPFEQIENLLISLFIGYYSFIMIRGMKIFFHTITSYFYLILYLCTVILAPLFGVYQILRYVYDFI